MLDSIIMAGWTCSPSHTGRKEGGPALHPTREERRVNLLSIPHGKKGNDSSRLGQLSKFRSVRREWRMERRMWEARAHTQPGGKHPVRSLQRCGWMALLFRGNSGRMSLWWLSRNHLEIQSFSLLYSEKLNYSWWDNFISEEENNW